MYGEHSGDKSLTKATRHIHQKDRPIDLSDLGNPDRQDLGI